VILAGDKTVCSAINKAINSNWNNEKLPEEWKESITAPIYKKSDETV
jgi:hypothetical protein